MNTRPAWRAPAGRRLLMLLAILTLWRLLAAWHQGMELYADEAQYWTWSLAPAWGYYSKPPMVAWAVWLGTLLFGDGEMGVRAVTVITYPLTAWILYLLVRRLFRGAHEAEAMAFWTGATFATLPMTSLGAWLITTDAFLLLFWSLAMYFAVAALETNRWRDWLLLGFALGLGLLSKYSMVFFGPALLAYLLITPARRRLLVDPRPYAAAVMALLLLVPNVVWNAGHQFVSYQHTAEISQLERELFNPGALLEFFLSQFAVFGPLLFAGLLALVLRPRGWLDNERLRLLACFALVPLAAFLALSLLSRAFANWAAFSYAAGAALVSVVWLEQGRRALLVASLALHLVVAVGMYHLHDLTDMLNITLSRKHDPYGRVTGYRALGQEVATRLAVHPEARLLTDERKLFALLRYYARPRSEGARYLNPSGGMDNHFALTADVRDAPAGTFLLVSERITTDQAKTWFVQAEPLPPIRLRLYPDHAPEYRVWLVRDYRGR